MRLSHPKREPGFTLIELMVTLTVAAVLLAVATPSFVDFFDRYRLRGAADAMISVISNARAEAVKTDSDVSIAYTGTANSATWCLGANAAAPPTDGAPAVAAGACDCTVATACKVSGLRVALETNAFPDVKIGALPGTFTFDSKLGTVSPLPLAPIVATLTSPRGKYDVNVEVNALGQARVCTPAGKAFLSGIPSC